MKTKIIGILILLLLASQSFALDKVLFQNDKTMLSKDGKWLVVKPFIDYNSVTFGIVPTDHTKHKLNIFFYINNNFIFKSEYNLNPMISFYQRFEYKTLDSICPNFSILKYLIYVDDNPIVIFEFHTNGSGTINFSFTRWLY